MATEIDILLKEVRDVKDFFAQKMEARVVPLQEEVTRCSTALREAERIVRDLQRQRLMRWTDDGRMRVADGRLAGYDMFSLKILEEIMRSRQSRGRATPKLLEAISVARQNIRAAITPDAILEWEDQAVKKRAMFGPNTPQRALASFRDGLTSWVRAMVNEQQKALDSTTAAAGDELVPTFEAAELWLDVNLDTLVLPILPQFPMPTNPFDIPRQLGDTNWYPASENVQVTTTNVGTGKTTLTAYGLKTGVPFSDELEEDAIVALVPEIRSSLVRNASEVIDDVLLNGDTTGANGINSDGATILTTTAGKAHWLLGFDGLIHAAIVDASSTMSIDAAGAISADLYNRGLSKLGRHAVPRRRGEVVYITDVNTATRSLSITEFETVDVAGLRATLSTGEIINVYGKPLIQSEMMRLADTDGKVTDSGNATATGRILCLNTTQWRVGFRRQITVETDREPGKGQTTMYVSFRIALTERTGTRSTQGHTSIVYDITGVNS